MTFASIVTSHPIGSEQNLVRWLKRQLHSKADPWQNLPFIKWYFMSKEIVAWSSFLSQPSHSNICLSPSQGFGSVFIWYGFGSGSSILGWIPIRIQGFHDEKLQLKKKFGLNYNLPIPRHPKRTFKLQKKPSDLKREYPALQNMKFLNFFSCCGSGSGFRIWIRIHWPDWIRIQSGSETLPPPIFPHPLITFCSQSHWSAGAEALHDPKKWSRKFVWIIDLYWLFVAGVHLWGGQRHRDLCLQEYPQQDRERGGRAKQLDLLTIFRLLSELHSFCHIHFRSGSESKTWAGF